MSAGQSVELGIEDGTEPGWFERLMLKRETGFKAFLDDLRALYNVPLSQELALRWDYPADLPVVRLDANNLKYILQQLISNAIKFTVQGHVTVSARYQAGSRTVEFKVADTGIGIPIVPILLLPSPPPLASNADLQ